MTRAFIPSCLLLVKGGPQGDVSSRAFWALWQSGFCQLKGNRLTNRHRFRLLGIKTQCESQVHKNCKGTQGDTDGTVIPCGTVLSEYLVNQGNKKTEKDRGILCPKCSAIFSKLNILATFADGCFSPFPHKGPEAQNG